MSTVIDELVTILGIDISGSAMPMLHKFNSAIDSIGRYAGWASGALMAAAGSAAYFVERFAETSAGIANFSQLTGVSSESLQQWMFAAEQAGGTADALQQDIMRLTNELNSPIPGEFNRTLFLMGINAKTATEALEKVADSPFFKNQSPQRQLQWGTRVGLSPDTIMLLQMERAEREKHFEQARNIPTIVDPQQLKDAKEFVVQMKLLRRIASYIGQEVSSGVGPALRSVVQGYTDWLKAHRGLVQSRIASFVDGMIDGFRRFGAVLRDVTGAIGQTLPWLGELVEGLMSTETISDVVLTLLLAISAAFIFVKGTILAGIAAFVALSLVVSDAIEALRGHKSLIGDWAKTAKEKAAEVYKDFSTKFPNIAKFIDLVSFAIGKLAKLIKDDLVYGFKLMWEGLKPIYEALKWLVSISLDKVFSGLDSMLSKISPDLWQKLKDKIGNFVDEESPNKLQSRLEDIEGYNKKFDKEEKPATNLQSDLDAMSRYNKPSVSSSTSTSNNNSTVNHNAPQEVTQNNYIQIQRAQSWDDEAIARKLGKAVHPKSYLYPGGKAPAVQ